MAIGALSTFEVRNGGSDTLNGGSFFFGATLTADGAATSATGNSPVFTSASYNFVAGDVGHWLFIKSGTNWTPGWYQIASVAANAATLSAAIGQVYLYTFATTGVDGPDKLNTVAGCATTSSPTGASWTIDYSQVDSVPFSLTGLTTAAANAIILTASATKAMIGNGIVITGGTNFTTGYYQVTAATAGVSLTVDRTCTSAAGAAGTAGLGGALASPGLAGSIATVAQNIIFIKYNASPYIATSASTNIAAGCVSGAAGTMYCGYDTVRLPYTIGQNRPTFQINTGVTSATLFSGNNNNYNVQSFILDANSVGTSKCGHTAGEFFNVKAMNATTAGLTENGTVRAIFCEATGCTTAPISVSIALWCVSHDNTTGSGTGGFTGNGVCYNCLAYGNSRSGFAGAGKAVNCVAYNNTEYGFNAGNNDGIININCIAENNGLYGYRQGFGTQETLINCADYNNTSGRKTSGNGFWSDLNPITAVPGTFFVDATNKDFRLNNTAGQGALCRAAGFPAAFFSPANLTANYLDIGAAQHQDSGGSSGPIAQLKAFQRGTPY